MSLKSYQRDFMSLAIAQDALTFGTYTLKSGRISPYFYDAGKFNKGSIFTSIGNIYATVLKEATKQDYDLIFVSALPDKYDMDVSYSFNRQGKKNHGEGGNIVGAQLKGNVLVVDDVISTETAIRESLEIIKENQANPVGVIVA
ncbi:10770_t:CDS:2, partial [Cetraspora pellucida]